MQILIHDLETGFFNTLLSKAKEKFKVITNTGKIKHCIGCFGCWVKTPGQCVIKDGYENIGALLAKADRVTVISKCVYGGYSAFVKNVLDRSISFLLPFFEFKRKETHHKPRYDKSFDLRVLFYGEEISEQEQDTARALVAANALNLHSLSHTVSFFKSPDQIGEKEVLA